MTDRNSDEKEPKESDDSSEDMPLEDIEEALEVDIPPEEAAEIARNVDWAIDTLELRGFIDEQWDKIHNKLVECEDYANGVSFGGDMIFVSTAIPLVNGIIHVGSTRENLLTTTQVLNNKSNWPRVPERIPAVSALTLIYLVAKGLKRPDDDDPDGLERFKKFNSHWMRMLRRVHRMSSKPDTKQGNGPAANAA